MSTLDIAYRAPIHIQTKRVFNKWNCLTIPKLKRREIFPQH